MSCHVAGLFEWKTSYPRAGQRCFIYKRIEVEAHLPLYKEHK